jgi:hypothetical protein
MGSRLALTIALLSAAEIVHSAPVEIDVPPYQVWCTTGTVRLAPDSQDNEAAKIIDSLGRTLQDEAAANKLPSIGLPFVTELSSTENKDGTTDNKVTLCSAVPQQSPKPRGKPFAATEPHRKGFAMLCDANNLEKCSAALEQAMAAAPWSLSQDGLDAATRRDHPALTSDASADSLVKSLLHTKDLLLGGDKSADTAPALQSSNVAVALLVDAP